MATLRRPKWTPPPPQTPRILQLPRRNTRRKPAARHLRQPSPAGKLNTLFEAPPVVLLNSGRRERVEFDDVEERESTSGDVEEEEEEERECRRGGGGDEEKWRFQAEMLRAECYLLRMEREVVVKKLESERCSLQKSLKSALHTLVSGKKKISEGENVSSVLEEEIEELSKKLVDLQRRSFRLKSPELLNCCNFDKQAFELQKELEEYNEMNRSEEGIEDVQAFSGTSLQTECAAAERKFKVYDGFSSRRCIRPADVETLRRKMERLSKGKLLKRMEEVYGSMLSATDCSLPSSASSSRRYDLADLSLQSSQEAKSGELKACSGQCKAIVMRLMEQVKAETDQWSQMQQMLGQVREEMEELQASRDFWETRALESDRQIQTLHSEVEEWKQKTVSSKIKENELQKQVQQLQLGLEKLTVPKTSETKVQVSTNSTSMSLGAQLAKEKHALTCRVKEKNPRNENIENKAIDYSEGKRSTLYKDGNSRPVSSFNRLPFKDIGNNQSPLGKQNSRRYVYPLHNLKDS